MSRNPSRLNWINGSTTAVALIVVTVAVVRLTTRAAPGDQSAFDLIRLAVIIATAGAGAGFIYNSARK